MFSSNFYKNLDIAPEQLVVDRKFDIAMRSQDVEYTKMKLSRPGPIGPNELQLLLITSNASREKLLLAQEDVNLWPNMLRDVFLHSLGGVTGRIKENEIISKPLLLAASNLRIQHEYNMSCDRTLGAPKKNQNFDQWLEKLTEYDEILAALMNLQSKFTELVEYQGRMKHLMKDKLQRKDPDSLAAKCKWNFPSIKFNCCWNDKICFVEYKSESWILPSVYLTMIHNKLCDTISAYLLMKSMAGNCLEKDALTIMKDFIVELCSYSIRNPENYFTLAKTLEGAIIGEIICREEEYANDELIINIGKDLAEDGVEYFDSEIRYLLKRSSTPLMHELGGLIKLAGHPVINMQKTVNKFLEKVQQESVVCANYLQRAVNTAKESFIRNYILKHKTWPPCTLDPLAPQQMVEAHRKGLDPSNPQILNKLGETTVDMYVYVELGQLKEFDRVHHYAQHLKDKTIALTRSKAFQKYVEKSEIYTNWKETRLLLMYLLRREDHDDLQEYLKEYMNDDSQLELVKDYLCIKLVPKEKELKEAGRLFGCKTYEDRFRSKVQEENAADFMDSYMLDQSMTLDNLGLCKRLYAFRVKNKAYRGWRALWVNFDVSSWAERWRKETTAPILSQTLDKIYDTNIFAKTHDAYLQGFFYIPDNLGGAYHWEGQGGGVQGLNQYTWMNCYVPMMRSILSQFGMHMYVMSYGDDYKACFLIPPDQANIDLTEFKKNITNVVAETATTKFAHVMKSFDCYGSECYISFCKKASVRAIELPQGMRKALKCHGSTNAFLPTIDDYVAGAFSNAHGACKELTVTYGPYFLALFWTFHHLCTHVDYNTLTNSGLLALSLTPSLLGGLPIIYLHNFHTRSESDLLAPWFDLVYYIHNNQDYSIAEDMLKFLDVEFQPGSAIIETLLRDPYSLPIEKPPLPSSVLRSQFKKHLRPLIRNEEVLELFDLADENWTERFVKCLVSSDNLQPRLLSAIYACTPKAILEEFLRRFENASSIKEVLVMRTGIKSTRRILRTVIESDRRLQRWRANVIRNLSPKHSYLHQAGGWCPSRAADNLRSKWGKPILGVTMAPSQHQISVVEETRGSYDPISVKNHFRYVKGTMSENLKGNLIHHWMLGDQEPFLGHKTRLNMELPSVRISERNPQLLKLQNLLDLYSWCNKSMNNPDGTVINSNLPDLIETLLHQFYRGDVAVLTPFGGKTKGGTIGHHVRSPHYKEFIMPNQLYNRLTFWRSETNCHQFFANSPGSHFSINFLLLKCFVVHLLGNNLEVSHEDENLGAYWGVTNQCDYCLREVVDPPVVVDDALIPPNSRILAFTKLDKHSELVLKNCLAEFQEKEILTLNRPGGGILPEEFACLTVMDYSVNREYQTHIALRDRFSAGIPLSDQARRIFSHYTQNPQQALVRLSELKKLPNAIIVNSLCNIIYTHMTSRYANTSRAGLQAEIRARPAEDLPWSQVLQFLIQASRIGGVVQLASTLSGVMPPAGYHNFKTLARWFGAVAFDIIDNGKLGRRMAIASYFDDDTILHKLKRLDYSCKAGVIATHAASDMRELNSDRNLDPDQSLYLTSLVIFLSQAPLPDFVALKDEIIDHSNRIGPVYEWNCAPFDEDGDIPVPDEDEFEAMLEFKTGPCQSLLEYYKSKFPKLQWNPDYTDYRQAFFTHWQHILYRNQDPIDSLLCEVAVTNIAESILRVRSLDPVRVREDDFLVADQGLSLSLFEPNPDAPVPLSCVFDNIQLAQQGVAVEDTDQIYDMQQILLSNYGLYRPFGAGTTSLNKVAYIMNHYNILHHPNDNAFQPYTHQRISCLGEGYGGILAMLASLSFQSSFVFNTLPESDIAYTFPEIARSPLQQNGHQITVDLTNTNVNDLSISSTLENLELQMNNLDLVTCDAECDWTADEQTYSSILHNVCIYYLRNRRHPLGRGGHRGGILILKIFLDAGRIPFLIINLLCTYCNHVGMYKCPGSPLGSEMYIIAYGFRRAFNEDYLFRGAIISPTVVRRLNTLKRLLRDDFDLMIQNYNITVDTNPRLRAMAFGYNLAEDFWNFPPAILQQVSGRFNIPIDANEFHNLDDQQSRVELLNNAVRRVAIATYNSLESGCNDSRRAWNSNTHTQQILIALQLISLQGFLRHLEKIMVLGVDQDSTQSVQDDFVKAMDLIPNRVFGQEGRTYLLYGSPIYSKGYTHNNIDFSFYEKFIQSHHWILGYKTWEMYQM
ncbi:putative RNA-dependent RNA polymerase [Freshwater macrophyte associated chu-like virus 1]|nr:putative RNA-dependent RNA polymerase [Freshwater macrophyte associated chu-like virus 1]